MATREELGAWKERIKHDDRELLFPGTFHALEVTPTEKIRYEENAKLSQILFDEFQELAQFEVNLERKTLIEISRNIRTRLSGKHQNLIDRIEKKLLDAYDRRPTMKQIHALLPRLYPYIFRIPSRHRLVKSNFVLSVSALGAPILTFKDKDYWIKRIRGGKGAQGLYPFDSAEWKERLPPELCRTVLILDEGDKEEAEKTRVHELFHDLYEMLFRPLTRIRYPDQGRIAAFCSIKNELIAHLLHHEWCTHAGSLLGLTDERPESEVFQNLFLSLTKSMQKEMSLDSSHAEFLANGFCRSFFQLRGQLVRLALKRRSADCDDTLAHLLAAQEMKEMLFHLSHVDSRPVHLYEDCIYPHDVGSLSLDYIEWLLKMIRIHELETVGLNAFERELRLQVALAFRENPVLSNQIENVLKKHEEKMRSMNWKEPWTEI